MRVLTTLTLSSLLCGFLALPASAQVPDYIASAPGYAEYPDQDGLMVRQMIRVTLDAAGKVEHHEETALKLLSGHLTRQGYLDPRVEWNETRSEMRIDQARTYMRDGTALDVKANSLVPNTADEMQWAVPYANQREMTIAHIGVEHDATSVLAYTITDRAPAGVPLWGVLDLQDFIPILDQWVTIQVPEGTTLHYAGIDCTVKAKLDTKDGLASYTFHRTNIAPVNTSEFQGTHQGLERLAFTTAPDWNFVRQYLEKSLDTALGVDAAVQKKANEVVEKSTLPAEQMALIHNFVVDGVHSVHWPLEAFDYAPRTAAEVLNTSVGHPLDKAVLLAAMLQAAGMDASVALVATEPLAADAVAALPQLDQAWVVVHNGPHQSWLDPMASADAHNGVDMAGKTVLIMDGEDHGLATLPGLTADQNRAALRVVVDVADGGHELTLSGSADLDLGYSYNPLAGYDRSGDRHKGLAGKVAKVWGGASVSKVFVGAQMGSLTSLHTEFDGGTVEVPAHGLVRLAVPRVPGAICGGKLGTHRGTRTQPLPLPGPATELVDIELTLPKGYELAAGPATVNITNSVGSVRREFKLDGQKLTISTTLLIKVDAVAPAAYPELRALLDALMTESAHTVLLQRTTGT